MKKEFIAGTHIAKYDSASETWDVYKNNWRIAIYNDSDESFLFTDKDTSHDVRELRHLIELGSQITRQYLALNQ